MIEHLIAQYGYLALLVGTFLEGETVLVIGGFAAHQGYLRLDLVIAVAFAGSLAGDQLAYFVGRRYGTRLIARSPELERRVARVTGLIERNATLFLLGFRFLYGLRIASPIAVALSNIPVRRFVLLNAVGAALWATAIASAGYVFGQAVEVFFGRLRVIEEWLLAAAVIAAAIFLIGRIAHRRIVHGRRTGTKRR